MQLKAMFFSLIMIAILPFMVVAMNHSVFFVVVGAIIFIASVKNLNTLLFRYRRVIYDDTIQSLDELEDLVNIDAKRFGIGLQIVKNAIIILFIIYCMFYASFILYKVVGALIILYWIKDSAVKFSNIKSKSNIVLNTWFNNMYFIIVNISTILLVMSITYIKVMTELGGV